MVIQGHLFRCQWRSSNELYYRLEYPHKSCLAKN